MAVSELHDKISDVFALVYRRVEWKKFTRPGFSAVDSLVSRLNVGKNEPDVIRCIERVCAGYSILSIPAAPEEIEYLMENNRETMQIIRENGIYVALLAQKKAKEN
jgi:hypothetical protein